MWLLLTLETSPESTGRVGSLWLAPGSWLAQAAGSRAHQLVGEQLRRAGGGPLLALVEQPSWGWVQRFAAEQKFASAKNQEPQSSSIQVSGLHP